MSQNPALNDLDDPVAIKLGVAWARLLCSESKYALQIQTIMPARRPQGRQQRWIFILRPEIELRGAGKRLQRDAMERNRRTVQKRQGSLVVREGNYPVSPERPNSICRRAGQSEGSAQFVHVQGIFARRVPAIEFV